MKAIKWFAGILEDKTGNASSKRVSTFILLFFLFLIVKGSLEGKSVDSDVLYIVAGLLAFSLGAITTEFVSFITNKKKERQDEIQKRATN